MARKRMISPEIWESFSFSALSDFAKLVFISLISHADDEGRGRAKAGTVTSMTFPNDDNRRVADVKKALQEIALKTSTQFYSVDGNEYYVFEKWLDWQKIDRPTKSKLPPPPKMGEGGTILNSGTFDDNSTSTRRVIDEPSSPNRIEKNRIEYSLSNACAREAGEKEGQAGVPINTALKDFLASYSIETDNYSPLIADMDFRKISEAYEASTFLQETPCCKLLSWVTQHYNQIITGKYKTFARVNKDAPVESKERLSNLIL